ncbi:MAG: methyltransferase domain-containing protein [Bacteroidetes bacterium]|nr:methyltransferase domain-containing protein [Bacteroidota bacterium]
MFFPDRIKNIKPTDRVLEIGPGADPHLRSDVFLEIKLSNPKEYMEQFGHDRKLSTDKPVVFYDGKIFPFKDGEFDYIICSHVLEHVEDVKGFLSELFRVGKGGYMEYPLVYYEYLYNFDVHLNFLKFDGKSLRFMKKGKSHLNEFKPVQDFFYESLKGGHVAVLNELIGLFMEGFEWKGKFNVEEVNDVSKVCHTNSEVPKAKVDYSHTPSAVELTKQLIKKVIKR